MLARRRRAVLVAGSVLLALILAVIIGSLVRTADSRPSRDDRLLPWLPRGTLVDDRPLIDSAEALWRDGIDIDGTTVVPPESDIVILWADRIGAGRVVIMEGIGVDDKPYVAQASEQGDPAVLGLDAVEELPVDLPVALAVTYDGNVHIAGLEPGQGSALIQLLPEPETSDVTGFWRFESSFAHTGLERLDLKPSGITETFLQLDKSDPAGTPVVVTTTVGANAGVAGTIAVRGGHLVATDSRIALVDDPAWGPTGRILGGEYTALSLAALHLDMADALGFVAASLAVEELGLGVLADLVVLRGPDGASRVACVVTDPGEREGIPDAVHVDPAEVDLDELRVLAGSCPVFLGPDRQIVAVAAARPGVGDVVLEAEGRVLAGPAESLAAVLDGAVPDGLIARLERDDGPGSSYAPAAVPP